MPPKKKQVQEEDDVSDTASDTSDSDDSGLGQDDERDVSLKELYNNVRDIKDMLNTLKLNYEKSCNSFEQVATNVRAELINNKATLDALVAVLGSGGGKGGGSSKGKKADGDAINVPTYLKKDNDYYAEMESKREEVYNAEVYMKDPKLVNEADRIAAAKKDMKLKFKNLTNEEKQGWTARRKKAFETFVAAEKTNQAIKDREKSGALPPPSPAINGDDGASAQGSPGEEEKPPPKVVAKKRAKGDGTKKKAAATAKA